MRQAGIKPVSVNTYLTCINAFLRWGFEEGHFPELLKVGRLRVEKKVLKTFSEIQLQTIIRFKPKTFSEHRIHALFCTLVDTGIRIEEALTLKTSAVDFDNLLITVRGKGNKERKVPFSFELRKVLFKFIRRHNQKFLFPVRGGGHLEYHNARRDFKALMERLGIEGYQGTFHQLRRTFASTYIRNGGNALVLQRLLGHTTLQMTNHYVSLAVEDLSREHERVNVLNGVH